MYMPSIVRAGILSRKTIQIISVLDDSLFAEHNPDPLEADGLWRGSSWDILQLEQAVRK